MICLDDIESQNAFNESYFKDENHKLLASIIYNKGKNAFDKFTEYIFNYKTKEFIISYPEETKKKLGETFTVFNIQNFYDYRIQNYEYSDPTKSESDILKLIKEYAFERVNSMDNVYNSNYSPRELFEGTKALDILSDSEFKLAMNYYFNCEEHKIYEDVDNIEIPDYLKELVYKYQEKLNSKFLLNLEDYDQSTLRNLSVSTVESITNINDHINQNELFLLTDETFIKVIKDSTLYNPNLYVVLYCLNLKCNYEYEFDNNSKEIIYIELNRIMADIKKEDSSYFVQKYSYLIEYFNPIIPYLSFNVYYKSKFNVKTVEIELITSISDYDKVSIGTQELYNFSEFLEDNGSVDNFYVNKINFDLFSAIIAAKTSIGLNPMVTDHTLEIIKSLIKD